MVVSGTTRGYWESFNLSGVSQVRQRFTTSAAGNQIVVGSRVIQALNTTSLGLFSSPLAGGGGTEIDILSTYDAEPAIAIDPSGYYYWLVEEVNDWYLTKLDNVNPNTIVWARKLQVPSSFAQGLTPQVRSDGNKVWFTARGPGLTPTNRLLFSVAADGSTSGSVVLNSLTYTFTTNAVTASTASAALNTGGTYVTTTTNPTRTVLSVTDSAGDFIIEGEAF
jgi:hypothetical protein